MPHQGEPREWNYWTRAKLDILAEYLDRFTTVAKSVPELVYLDAFAGEGEGRDRLTGEAFDGSPRIALRVDSPPFTKLRFFERPTKAAALKARLQAEYPGRDLDVYGGDCNTMIPRALQDLRRVAWAPTFAFLDPDGMELAWETIATLAKHRQGKAGQKVELWLLFSDMGLLRTLALDTEPSDADSARATRLFGTDAWRSIFDMRRDPSALVDGWMARRGYLNLYRWRLERELGYRWTMPLEFRNLHGGPMYTMIFATANETGERIMRAIYGKAEVHLEAMREDARATAQGREQLFKLAALPEKPRRYEYVGPFDPDTFPRDVY